MNSIPRCIRRRGRGTEPIEVQFSTEVLDAILGVTGGASGSRDPGHRRRLR